jgi:hypothetical protein
MAEFHLYFNIILHTWAKKLNFNTVLNHPSCSTIFFFFFFFLLAAPKINLRLHVPQDSMDRIRERDMDFIM